MYNNFKKDKDPRIQFNQVVEDLHMRIIKCILETVREI